MTNSKSIERCTLLSFIMLRVEKHSFFFLRTHKKGRKKNLCVTINFNPNAYKNSNKNKENIIIHKLRGVRHDIFA